MVVSLSYIVFWFFFIRIYPISFVDKFNFVNYIGRWKNELLMVLTLNIQSAWIVWDGLIKKTYTTKINVRSYLLMLY
jgi:hypothetical protein